MLVFLQLIMNCKQNTWITSFVLIQFKFDRKPTFHHPTGPGWFGPNATTVSLTKTGGSSSLSLPNISELSFRTVLKLRISLPQLELNSPDAKGYDEVG